MVVAMKGWSPVATTAVDSTPPGKLVDAALSCMEVELHTKNATRLEARRRRRSTRSSSSAATTPTASRRTRSCVFYLQEKRWWCRTPPAGAALAAHGTVVSGEVSGGSKANCSSSSAASARRTRCRCSTRRRWSGRCRRRARRGEGVRQEEEGQQGRRPRRRRSCRAALRPLAATFEQTLYVFGSQTKNPLGELTASCPSSDGVVVLRGGDYPPPAANHACAVVRDHLLLICGDDSWRPPVGRAAPQPPHVVPVGGLGVPAARRPAAQRRRFVTPRPHRREEVLVFGGVIGRDIVDIFMTLDTRTWEETGAVLPRAVEEVEGLRRRARGAQDQPAQIRWQVRAATRCQLRISPASHPHLTPHLTPISPPPSGRNEEEGEGPGQAAEEGRAEGAPPPRARRGRTRRDHRVVEGAVEMTDGEEEPDDGRGDRRREGYDEDEIGRRRG